MSRLISLIYLLLYTSLWVGICAAALVVFTYEATGGAFRIDAYTGFVFFGTVGLYALHRILGLRKVIIHGVTGRFVIIEKFRSYIQASAVIGILGAITCVFFLHWRLLLLLVIPCLISLLYTVPLIRGRRLRDLDWIKIFLVSVIWSLLTGVIPFMQSESGHDFVSGFVIFIERASFAFAITLPFDVRDREVDRTSGVRTLAHILSPGNAQIVSVLTLTLAVLCTAWLIASGQYDAKLIIPAIAAYMISLVLVVGAGRAKYDWYFSGLLDGSTILLPICYWVFQL